MKDQDASTPLVRNLLLEDMEEENRFVRLLSHCPERDEWACLDLTLEGRDGLPQWRASHVLRTDLLVGRLAPAETDPFVPTEPLEERSAATQAKAKECWALLAPLVSLEDSTLMEREARGQAIRLRAEEMNVSPRRIRRLLYRYWEGGQVPAALAPRYAQRGGPGVPKRAGVLKRGARNEGGGTDVNVTPEMARKLVSGYKEFVDGKQYSLKDAWDSTIRKHFSKGTTVILGTKVPGMPHPNEVPSYHQFEYHGRKSISGNEAKSLRRRVGSNAYHLKHRPVVEGVGEHARGPGDRYEVDATIGDITLISAMEKDQVVGSPTLYLVVDVFSTMIVGVSALLGKPSWAGMMCALRDAFSPKVPLCRRHGIEIQQRDWPCHHLPHLLVGDRGELMSHAADRLSSDLGILVGNTATRRADWKGHVERAFRKLQESTLRAAPGRSTPRGEPSHDPREEAGLTLDDYQRSILVHAVKHNCTAKIENEDRIPEGYPLRELGSPTPLDLWNWGIANRAGFLRSATPEQVRTALLPTGNARPLKRHVTFRGLKYGSRDMIGRDADASRSSFVDWFLRGTGRKLSPNSVPVRFDPRNAATILVNHPTEGLKPFDLARGDRKYTGLSFVEVRMVRSWRQKAMNARKKDRKTEEWALQELVESMFEVAENRRQGRPPLSKEDIRKSALDEGGLRGYLDATESDRPLSPPSTPEAAPRGPRDTPLLPDVAAPQYRALIRQARGESSDE